VVLPYELAQRRAPHARGQRQVTRRGALAAAG